MPASPKSRTPTRRCSPIPDYLAKHDVGRRSKRCRRAFLGAIDALCIAGQIRRRFSPDAGWRLTPSQDLLQISKPACTGDDATRAMTVCCANLAASRPRATKICNGRRLATPQIGRASSAASRSPASRWLTRKEAPDGAAALMPRDRRQRYDPSRRIQQCRRSRSIPNDRWCSTGQPPLGVLPGCRASRAIESFLGGIEDGQLAVTGPAPCRTEPPYACGRPRK